jgi:hypothetical protein
MYREIDLRFNKKIKDNIYIHHLTCSVIRGVHICRGAVPDNDDDGDDNDDNNNDDHDDNNDDNDNNNDVIIVMINQGTIYTYIPNSCP